MQFTREKINSNTEKDIAISCIVSTEFLEQTDVLLKNLSLISEPHLRRIISWCLDFYKRHNHAPGKLIFDIFISNKKSLDSNISDAISTVLSSLNETYIDDADNYASSYYVTKARDYIEEQSLLNLCENIKGAVSLGKLEVAKEVLLSYNKIDKVVTLGLNVHRDKAAIDGLFSAMKSPLVTFPYPHLQEFMKDTFRGDLIGVSAPSKRGKSFLMMELSRLANRCGLNCAYFTFEMDNPVLVGRYFQSIMGQTRKETETPIVVPYFDKDSCIFYEEQTKEGLDYKQSLEFQQIYHQYANTGEMYFFDHHTCVRTVDGIANALDRLEKYEGVKIDVVVIDYDALLEAPPGFKGQPYEAITNHWKDVKAKIAQDRDTLCIMGSQVTKEGAKAGNHSPIDTAGSSHKFDYVSHMISIHATDAERAAGIMRLSVEGRHDEFVRNTELVCLQSLSLARPILDCRWKDEIPNYEEIITAHKPQKEEKKKEDNEAKIESKVSGWEF